VILRLSVGPSFDLGWWPAFNLADVGIATGVAVAFVARR